MCGFAGVHTPRGFQAGAETFVRKMADRLWQRGPDDAGAWSEPRLGTALAFRRLAILDASERGHQPMVTQDGRFVLAMNGEVYNHKALRAELESKGSRFLGSSDAEVLLEGVAAWGLEGCLRRCIGMFAIVLIDVLGRQLLLARDRLGEKPLYYGWSNGHFFFGSELNAFRPHPGFDPQIDRGALTLYLRHGYIPSPHCIFSGFHKLLPGHILTLRLDGSAVPGSEAFQSYWTIPKPGEQAPFTGAPADCVRGLEELLGEVIRLQMVADVPVGAFLSGGIDSSTVVSLMMAQAAAPVKTFTIGFPDCRYDESHYAERIAAHLGTDHTTWACSDAELLDLVQQIPRAYSEPFADDSQLPTMALARTARRQVTVSLSGDGGDELFHGYGRYEKSLRRWQQVKSPVLGSGLRCGINSLAVLAHFLAESPWQRRLLCQLSRARTQWLPEHLSDLYRYRMSMNKAPDLYLTQPEATPEFFDEAAQMKAPTNDASWLSYLDLNTYLPDDLLVKVDRAAMAFSLETRMPLLDHRVVEYAAQIPETIKRRGGKSKWPLRQILERSVPRELIDRPKGGFSTPMDRWLRGPLREWAEAQLCETRVREDGFFQVRELRRLWNQHQQGVRERGYMLWGFLMYQAWHEAF